MKGKKKSTEGILVSSHRGNHSNTFSGARKRLDCVHVAFIHVVRVCAALQLDKIKAGLKRACCLMLFYKRVMTIAEFLSLVSFLVKLVR